MFSNSLSTLQITSAPIGACEVRLPAFKQIKTDQPTNQPTDRPTNRRAYNKVSLTIISVSTYLPSYVIKVCDLIIGLFFSQELLSVRVRNEGEFWMSFDDFAKQFSHLDLVHIGNDI